MLTEPAYLLVVLTLSMARITAIFATAPFLNEGILSGLNRTAMLVSFSLLVFPMVQDGVPHTMPGTVLFVVMVKEVVIGMIIGYLSGLAFWAAEGVGYLIDNQRGTTTATVFDPLLGDQTSPLGSMILKVITTLFFCTGGLTLFLGLVMQSYKLMPIMTFFPRLDGAGINFFLHFADTQLKLVVLLAAPLMMVMFLIDFGLGLVNRFAPALNVFFLSMPVKSAAALALLSVYLITFIPLVQREFFDLGHLNELYKLLSPAP